MMRLGAILLGIAGAVAGVLVAVTRSSSSSSSSTSSSPTTGGVPFVQARTYKRGPTGRPVDWIVLHTTDPPKGDPLAPGVASSTAQYFATLPAGRTASAHFVVGSDEEVQCVRLDDVAWHAPPANEKGVGIEFTARTAHTPGGGPAFTPEDWADARAEAMLERGARRVAAIAAEKNVPTTFVDAAALLRGERGITTHREVARAWRKTDHTDPGEAFPLDHFLELVRSNVPVA